MSFRIQSSGAGPTQGAVYWSTDGFSSEAQLGSNFIINQESGTINNCYTFNENFPPALQNLTSATTLTVRVYGWAASGSQTSTNFRLEDVQLSGHSVTQTFGVPCVEYLLPAEACNSTLHLRPRIVPVDADCNNPTLAARSFNIVCPTLLLSGNSTVCAPATGTATISASNTGGGEVSVTLVRLSDASTYGPFTRVGDGIVSATGLPAGEYQMQTATVTNACTPSLVGIATVQINAAPSLTLTGITDVCSGLVAEVPFTINAGTLPFTLVYNLNGGTPQTVEVFFNQIYIPATGLAPGVYPLNILSLTDANGCVGTATGNFTINVLAAPNLAPVPLQNNSCPAEIVDLSTLLLTDLNNTTGTLSYHPTLADAIANTNPVSAIVHTSGTYFIRKQTTLGCFATTAVQVNITTCLCNNVPTLALSTDTTVCQGTPTIAFPFSTSGEPDRYSLDFESPLLTDLTNQALPDTVGNLLIALPVDLPGDTYTATLTVQNSTTICSSPAYPLTIRVLAVTPGSISGDQTICLTKDPTAFTGVAATATPGATIRYQWERSYTDCNNNFTPLSDTEWYDLAQGELPQTAYFRRRAIAVWNGTTCEALSNCITVQVLAVQCRAFPWNGNE